MDIVILGKIGNSPSCKFQVRDKVVTPIREEKIEVKPQTSDSKKWTRVTVEEVVRIDGSPFYLLRRSWLSSFGEEHVIENRREIVIGKETGTNDQ